MSYKIGSFNCLHFGRGVSKDIKVFSDIILREQFDIIALQEIKGNCALKRILDVLPPYWTGIADEDSSVYDYAFIWNTRRFILANAEEVGKSRVYFPRIYKHH